MFFRAKPPKTAGREEFGREFVATFCELRARPQTGYGRDRHGADGAVDRRGDTAIRDSEIRVRRRMRFEK